MIRDDVGREVRRLPLAARRKSYSKCTRRNNAGGKCRKMRKLRTRITRKETRKEKRTMRGRRDGSGGLSPADVCRGCGRVPAERLSSLIRLKDIGKKPSGLRKEDFRAVMISEREIRFLGFRPASLCYNVGRALRKALSAATVRFFATARPRLASALHLWVVWRHREAQLAPERNVFLESPGLIVPMMGHRRRL